jgi:hypothetical protein
MKMSQFLYGIVSGSYRFITDHVILVFKTYRMFVFFLMIYIFVYIDI